MKYFSGFSLQNEVTLFEEFIPQNSTTVAGFSYGAQKALEFVYTATERVDRLILLSPAFFQTEKYSFIRTQLRHFEAVKEVYIGHFLDNLMFPSTVSIKDYLCVGTKEELDYLLTYVWDETKIQAILDKGTSIEVFLGEEDQILDIQNTISFFSKKCTTYIVKKSGHILKENDND